MACRAEVLTIGDELLRGNVLNSNACFLSRQLSGDGFHVVRQVSCEDRIPSIVYHLRESLVHAELIVMSGGLGPTPDDVTRDALASFFSAPLQFSRNQYARIRKIYAKHGKKVPAIVRQEALFPKNAVPLINDYGIALGFYIPLGGKMIVVLPGVPRELEKMFIALVRPLLKRYFRNRVKKYELVIKTLGISEPTAMRCLGRGFVDGSFDFGIYPQPGEVTIRLASASSGKLKALRRRIKPRLGKHVYAYADQTLAEVVVGILKRKRARLAVAESCTGGQLAAAITGVAGASRIFRGGIVAYDNRVKTEQLGVDAVRLAKTGAVDAGVARMLALRAREKFKARYALGITGIAGPGGGSRKKPVGTVFIALAQEKGCRVWQERFWGDRGQVQTKAVKKSLEYLWRAIR